MKIYKILLCLKVPNEKGVMLDFRTKSQDITYGILAFNKQFKGEKIIKLLRINEGSIELLLKIKKFCEVTAREITYFSKRLHHDRNWKSYSRDETKLFTAKQFIEVTSEFINEFDNIQEINDYNAEKNIEGNDVRLSDEDAINALKALINLQNIGTIEVVERRKEVLIKIKKLLLDVL